MTTEVTFLPLNDQILLKLDVKKRSILELKDSKPTILPSGVVCGVGRGVFVPGKGWLEPQVKIGDHVALILDGAAMLRLPITKDDDEIYISISESQLIGRLEGADEKSCWWTSGEKSALGLH